MLSCTRAELQRHMLRQQCLASPVDSVEAAVTAMLGCRGAEGSTPYLSLLWRVKGFDSALFDRAVHQERSLLRVKGPRGTNYWVTRAQAPLFLAAAEPVGELLQAWGLPEGEYRALEEHVSSAVTGRPLPMSELKRSIAAALQRPLHRQGYAPGTALIVAIEAMQRAGKVTLLKEPGLERHRPLEYHGDARDVTRPNLVGLVAELYPGLAGPAETEARRELLRAYISTFGPVTLADIAWWTGWTKRAVNAHLRSLAHEIDEMTVEGLPGTFWIHREAWERRSASLPDLPGDAFLLPGGDSLLKGYEGFGRFLARPIDDHNVLRFMPAVLVDGLGAGNWAYRLTPSVMQVVVEVFEPLTERHLEPLRRAATRVGRLVAGDSITAELFVNERVGPWNPRAPFPAPKGRER